MSWSSVLSSIAYYSGSSWSSDPGYPIYAVNSGVQTEIEDTLYMLYHGSPMAAAILEGLALSGNLNFASSDDAGHFYPATTGPQYIQLNFDEMDYLKYFNSNGAMVGELRHLYLMHELVHAYSGADDPVQSSNTQLNELTDLRGLPVDITNQVAAEMGDLENIRASYFASFHPDSQDNRASYFNQDVSYTLDEAIDNVRLGYPQTFFGFYTDPDDNIDTRGLDDSRDLIFGLGGDDTIHGGDGRDFIYGGEDDDNIYGGKGDDHIEGGDGFDTSYYSESSSPIRVMYNGSSSIASLTVQDGMGGTDTLSSIEKIVGTDKVDILAIAGNIQVVDTSERITFDAAHGQIGSRSRQDVINAIEMALGTSFTVDISTNGTGTITDNVTGGIINLVNYDTSIIGTSSDDTITDLAEGDGLKRIDGGEGDDTIEVDGSDAQINGGAGDDTITSGAGNDVLAGGEGSDTIDGGDGSDKITINGNIDDLVEEVRGGDGHDKIIDESDATDTTNIWGGGGNDYIQLGEGSSAVIHFGAGDGHDVIDGLYSGFADIDMSTVNKSDVEIRFEAKGIIEDIPPSGNPTDIPGLLTQTGDVVITIKSTGDTLLVRDVYFWSNYWFDQSDATSPPYTDWWHEEIGVGARVTFADGYLIPDDFLGSTPTVSIEFGSVAAYDTALQDYEAAVAGDPGDNDGTSGDDDMSGTPGDDAIDAGDGDDSISSSGGNDTVDGGGGNDTLMLFSNRAGYNFSLSGGVLSVTDKAGVEGSLAVTAVEKIYFLAENAEFTPEELTAIYGTSGNDTLWGDTEDNLIFGLAGNDTINGDEGNDTIDGGDGDDTAEFFGYADEYRISRNQDGTLTAESIFGWEGTDTLKSVEQLHFLGDDVTLTINDIPDLGTSVADTIVGSDRPDLLVGLAGDDAITGGLKDDEIDGGDGNDTANFSGNSADYVLYRNLDGSITVADYYGSGDDGFDTLRNVENFHFAGDNVTLGLGDIADLGTSGNDIIAGTTRNDRLYGLGGDDTLTGDDGSDEIDGGEGADTMAGGDGDDSYIVDDVGDIVSEGANEGYDFITSSISLTLAANVEGLGLGLPFSFDDPDLDGTGNGLDNEIYGNRGDNVLNGKEGNDTLFGGSDFFSFDMGSDTFVFDTALGSNNVDAVFEFDTVLDKISLDTAIFTGLSTGSLSSGAFVIGSAALDASDRIIYDDTTGSLYFDADGSASGSAIEFAILGSSLDLTAANFVLV